MMWKTHYEKTLPFVANEHSLVRAPGRQIDWVAVGDGYGGDAFTVTLDAAAEVDDDTLTVVALPGPIPAGAVLYFGADKFARVTAAADAGDTELAVEELVTAIADESTATYYPGRMSKSIPAGTIMAELSNGKIVPRAGSGSDTATCILESTAVEGDTTGHAGYGVIVGGAIFSNLLPDAGHASFDTWIGELETAGVGTGYHWATYGDDTVS